MSSGCMRLASCVVLVAFAGAGFIRADPPKETIKHSFLALGNETYILDDDGKVVWRYPNAADLAAGTFDTAIHWSTTGPSPYATYDSWLDPALAKGTNRSGNYGDFENAAATAALAAYAKAGTAQQAQDAINTISKVMSEQVPDAPIMYAAGWYEYNTTNYSGWVDKDNQYVDPSPNPANVEYVVLHLKPNS